MTGHPRDQDLEPLLTGLIRKLLADEPSVAQVLERVVVLATQIVGADGASISLYMANMRPHTVAASHDWVRKVDQWQYQTRQGPCLEVAATSAPAAGSADLAHAASWPVFGPGAAKLGVRSVLAVGVAPRPNPAKPAEGPPGALNLYARKPFAFGVPEREETLLLAAIAGLCLQIVEARIDAERLREALTTRDVIGQAKGMLMERHGISEDEAFAILRRASNDLNIKLRDVAQRVAEHQEVTETT